MSSIYNEVLVCYDIESNKSRTKLFARLKALSLKPIQKSVFWGHLNAAEERAVQRLLKEHCAKGDRGFIVRARLSAQIAEKNSVGYQRDRFPAQPTRYDVI